MLGMHVCAPQPAKRVREKQATHGEHALTVLFWTRYLSQVALQGVVRPARGSHASVRAKPRALWGVRKIPPPHNKNRSEYALSPAFRLGFRQAAQGPSSGRSWVGASALVVRRAFSPSPLCSQLAAFPLPQPADFPLPPLGRSGQPTCRGFAEPPSWRSGGAAFSRARFSCTRA
jgi:hypothetical protein